MNRSTTAPTADTSRSGAPRRAAGFRRAGAAVLGSVLLGCALAGCGGTSAASSPAAALPLPAQQQDYATAGAPSSWPTAAAQPSGAGGTTAAAVPPAGPGSASPGDPKPLSGRTIVVDPGHNPNNTAHPTEINRQVDVGNGHKECDTTGTETNAGYTEAAYSLDVSHRLRDLLQGLGATVVLTQDGDRGFGPCVDERAAIGNKAHADAAISIHGDGGPASGSGFHVIMPAKVVAGKADNSAVVAPSHTFGLLLRDAFHQATGEPFADYVADQGLDTRDDLGGLNLSTVPKVFIETGNMRNSGDAQRMTDPQWRQRAAQGIADAFTAFLTGGSNGSGTKPGPASVPS
ncbi:N-acetylmuramoyl-L-alanine amidase [Kitasatospora sp. NPDC006697]|uniref:N-acetylmuramoyl-L-alanine amidase n=1 Tax=Kitasatospora sp. NPDC006697 TaxID=3364020 RepID=UPI00369517CE